MLNILRLDKTMFFRLFLLIIFIPLQSCSNTVIGEKLENSFDSPVNQTNFENKKNNKNKLIEKKQIKLSKKDNNKKSENVQLNIVKEKLISSENKLNKKSTKSMKKVIFKPQPYRIIIKLSGANPSAPAETVTKALRKAGVQFEVEKIERFDDEGLLKNKPSKR